MAIKRNTQLKTSSVDEFSSIKASCNAPDVDFTLCIYREGIRSDLAIVEACRESAGDSLIEVAIDSYKALPQYGSDINKAIVSRLPDECLGEQFPHSFEVLAEPKEGVGLNLVLAFGKDPDRKRFFNLYDDVFTGLSDYKNFVRLSSLRLDPVDCNTEEESVRREIDKDRRRYPCFSGKEKCKLFVPERGKRTELVKAGKDFEIVESDILYKDARIDSNVFGGIFDVRDGMEHGECLSVMLDYDLDIDSLKAMSYRFVRQFLNDDDKISFVCGKSSFDYLTDSSFYDRISGESSLKEFFAGLNGVKDNWSPVFDFDYCKAVFELSGSKLKLNAYRGGTRYQPDFVIDAGAKVFPDMKIVVTDKKFNVKSAKERKYNKHSKMKNGLWP